MLSDEEINGRIIRRLYRRGNWGAGHTLFENLKKGFTYRDTGKQGVLQESGQDGKGTDKGELDSIKTYRVRTGAKSESKDVWENQSTWGASTINHFHFSTLYRTLKDAIGRKKGHNDRNSKKERIRRIKKLKASVRKLMGKKYDCKDCKRYVKPLKREIDSLFAFILHDVQYCNNIGERMLRTSAEARKVLYGSRTKKGADMTAIMMSVYATCAESTFMILHKKSVWQEKQL